jgi:hypothetical protein
MKRLAALLLFFSALSLGAQDKAHRLVETGFDAHGSFANSYLRTGDVFKEKIYLDISKMAEDLGNGLGVFFDARLELFLNFNLGATWGFGFFTGLDARGQFKIPQSLVELVAEGNDLDKTYSEELGLGAAAFYEAGFWASAKIRRIKFTARPAYYVPLAYLSNPNVRYTFALEDDGSIKVAGTYNIDVYSPLSLDSLSAMGDNLDLADVLRNGGVDLILRAEYPVYYNFILGATLGHIPLIPAQLTEKYSFSGGFEINKTIEDLLNKDFDVPEPTMTGEHSSGQKAIFRPFKIGFDAVYRPFNIRLLTLRPDLALVFNSVYNTPVYLDFGISGELNLADIFTVSIGTHLEDLVWKERVELMLNLRVVELVAGITTQSQSFLRSFQGAGFGVDVGLRLGF